jgi:hypothetical protein
MMMQRKLKITRFQLIICMAAAMIFAAGCNSEVTVNVSLPPNIDVNTLQVVSSQNQTRVSAEGNITLTRSDRMPFMVVATSGDTPVAMTLVLPGRETNRISCLDTAAALVLIRTGLTTAPDYVKASLVDQVKSVTAVKDMADAICDALASDITAVANPDATLKNTLIAAEKAVVNHLKSLQSSPR